MKCCVALALTVLVTTCSVANAEDGKGDSALSMTSILNLLSRIYRFRKLVEDKIADGTLDNPDELGKPIQAAFLKALDCFKKELTKFGDVIMKLMSTFQNAITGSSPIETKAESPSGESSAPSTQSIFSSLLQLAASYYNAINGPEVSRAFQDVRKKLEESILVARDCFTTNIEGEISPEEATLMKKLWDESGTQSSNNAPADGIKE